MMEMPPLPEVELPKLPRRPQEGYSVLAMQEYAVAYAEKFAVIYGESCARMAREEEREKLRALVLDDAWSLTFQTFGQYRTALAAAIRKG